MELNSEPHALSAPPLPSGWRLRSLGDLARIKTGSKDTQDKDVSGLYPFFVRSQTVELIGTYSMDCEAILVPGEGGIGSIFHYIDGKFDYHQRVYGIFGFANDVDGRYVFYYMVQHFGAEATKNSVKATVDSLRLPTFKQFLIRVPPLAEQRAIAEALSNVDALIAALDALIAKKRAVKTAAMQQLLTSRQRLPGFSGEWVTRKLGDVIKEISDGATPSTAKPENFGGTIPWVVIDDIEPEITSTTTKLTERGLRSCAATLWPAGTLIVSTGATIGEVGIARVPLATKQGICGVVVESSKALVEYLLYWIIQNKPLILSKAQGSSIKEVRPPTLVRFEIALPGLAEQGEIVTVLSDMDAEIAALEARCDKTRHIKTGMMQELLTGRTRLVPQPAE